MLGGLIALMKWRAADPSEAPRSKRSGTEAAPPLPAAADDDGVTPPCGIGIDIGGEEVRMTVSAAAAFGEWKGFEAHDAM